MSTGAVLAAVLGVILAVGLSRATTVKECSGDSSGKRLSVDIANCKTPPCILKKKTNASVEIKFTSGKAIEKMKNRVYAKVLGVPLPFVGVDGESSCENIYLTSGDKAGCPIKADTQYLYKNTFEIHPYYPTISPLVHWGLQDEDDGTDVVCFEVKSTIRP